MTRSQATRRGLPLLVQLMLSVLFGLFVAGGVYSAYLFYLTVKEVAAHAQFPTMPVLYLPVPGQKPVPVLVKEETVNWEKKERANILLLGIDRRPGEEGPWRTDTMILGTIDPATQSAGMLSIPRDLWVTAPGYGENRINMAHFLGDSKGYPGGGPALAKKTVQYNLGVPVNYYVRIDFDGFRKLVDSIGGVDIDVETAIIDDTYPDELYGYDPLYIEAGRHHMDGEMALKYARTRHQGQGDFDRAKRQQQVLLAIRDQALHLNLLPKLPELMVILADTVQTDLQPSDILTLAQIGFTIDRNNVKTAVLDQNCTVRHITPTGADVLLPVREKIRPIINDMFAASPAVPVKKVTTVKMVEEGTPAVRSARVAVENGTTKAGLGPKAADYLRRQGFTVGEPGEAPQTDYPHTVVIEYTGKTQSAEQLADLFGVPRAEIRHSPSPQSSVDIRVILGADFRLPS